MTAVLVSSRIIGGVAVPCVAPPEWQNIEVMPGYANSFQLLSKRILLQIPAGIASAEGVSRAQRLRDKFLEEFLGPKARFIQVRNYSRVPGLPSRESRKVQSDLFELDAARCDGMIACGLSPMMRTMIRVGLLVTQSPYPFKLVGTEQEALHEALVLERGLLDITSKALRQTRDDWKIDLGNFKAEAWVIAPHIFGFKAEGWLKNKQLDQLDELQSRVLENQNILAKRYYRILDLSEYKGSDWKIRSQFRANMDRTYARFGRPQASYICDANPFVRTAFRIFSGSLNGTIRFCPSVEKALQLIQEESQTIMSTEVAPESPPIGVDELQQLAENIGRLSWKDPGQHFPSLPASHRLRPVYDALELVHLDLHSLLEASDADAESLHQAKCALDSALKARSELLAAANHEIRTPLNGLQGMLELMESCQLPSEAREYLETARQCSDDLAELLYNLLDLSTVESGRLQLEANYFSSQAIVMEIEQKHIKKITNHNLEFKVIESGLVDSVVYGDGRRLFLILDILVQTAIKFTAQGAITLEYKAELVQDRIAFVFQVRDTGVGVHPETLPRIFEPFTQVDSSFARQYGFVGLRLAVVKQLTQMLGGTIVAESVVGQGTCFTLHLSFSRQL